MCVSSMVGDFYRDKWSPQPWWLNISPTAPYHQFIPGQVPGAVPAVPISRKEFDDLKREVLDMKEMLKRAKEYDARNGEPECEIDEKMDLLRRVAKLVRVDLGDVLPPSREGGA